MAAGSGQAQGNRPVPGQVKREAAAQQLARVSGSRPSSGAVKIELDLTDD